MGRPKKQASISVKKMPALSGIGDVLADTDALWGIMLRQFQNISKTYGFARAELPLLEPMRLYEQLIPNYELANDQFVTTEGGEDAWVVRPSLLPSLLRAYSMRKLYETSPFNKWVATGQVLRKTDKGEIVAGQEFIYEVIGNFNHLSEAQLLGAVWTFLARLGLAENLQMEINHIGDSECQTTYETALADFLRGKKFGLCDNCTEHLRNRPLSILRCGNVECQALLADAPILLDFLDQGSQKHFTTILEALDELGIPYQVNPLYAGDHGHSRTNAVIKYKHGQKTSIIGEAAYHDQLLGRLAGKNICSFGFVGNFTAILKILEQAEVAVTIDGTNEVYLVPLGELAARKSLRLFRDLISARVTVYDNFGSTGVKDQLKAAQASRSPIALIMGQKEAIDDVVILRDVKSGMQEVFSYDKIVDEVKKRLGK